LQMINVMCAQMDSMRLRKMRRCV